MEEQEKIIINDSIDKEESNQEEIQNEMPKEISSDDETYSELKNLINEHFLSIRNLIRYSKEKDLNVLTLSKQMQSYRDGFEITLLKRVAMEIISYREECKKSLRECEQVEISTENAKKYLEYLVQDFSDLLENLGVTDENGEWCLNGKSLNSNLETPTIKEVPKMEDVQLENRELNTIEDFAEYLKNAESSISTILKNNVILDSLLNDYIKNTAIYEQGLHQIVLYPVIKKIIKLYENLKKEIQNKESDINDYNEIYKYILAYIDEKTIEILNFCNVTITKFTSNEYNPQKQRIIKFIETEDIELNGKMVFQYTDCYEMNDKVIYPAKVDIYKTK